jgi:hypothetical protein
VLLVIAFALLAVPSSANAQQPGSNPPASAESAPPSTESSPSGTEAVESPPPSAGTQGDRIFGFVPNYTTIEGATRILPVTNAQTFKMATQDSFDPFAFPLYAFVAGFDQLTNAEPTWGSGWNGYAKRYGAALVDNTLCSLFTTAVMPTLLQQDPRYFTMGTGGVARRVGYAASRSLITRSRTGKREINFSEIIGTAMVASVANFYYPASEHTVPDTLVRWGTQAMWDSVANELKEFWPDVRRKVHKS